MVLTVKKVYKTPSIKVHGSIADMTRSNPNGKIPDGKVSKGTADFYSSSDPEFGSAPIVTGGESF